MLCDPGLPKSVNDDNVVEPELATPWSMVEHERCSATALRSFLMPEHLRPRVKHDEYTHEEIPVIDIAPYLLGGDEAAMAAIVAQVRDACLIWGFFHIVNHGIEDELHVRVLRQAEAFFRLPYSEKMKVAKEPGRYTGYGHATVKKDDIRPWAEGLFFANDGSVAEFSRNLFPPGTNNDFVDSYNEYNAKAQQLASTLMSIIVQGLEVDPARFERYTKNSGGYFRWNYYPACPVPEQTLGLKPHTDFNLVTILFQSDVGGLQIEKDGRWVAVKPRPGALCVNIGDTIQVLTNKKYMSVPHRAVVNATKTRISLGYFYSPLPSMEIFPSPDLVDENNPAKYKSFTFQNFTKMKQTHFLNTLEYFEVKNE